jgi:hypothetical protein
MIILYFLDGKQTLLWLDSAENYVLSETNEHIERIRLYSIFRKRLQVLTLHYSFVVVMVRTVRPQALLVSGSRVQSLDITAHTNKLKSSISNTVTLPALAMSDVSHYIRRIDGDC